MPTRTPKVSDPFVITMIVVPIIFVMAFIGLVIYEIRRHRQLLQRLLGVVFQCLKEMFTRPLHGYMVRRQARPDDLSPHRADELEGATELADLRHRRGSRSVPSTQRGVVAENRGSETRPEDTDVDETRGQYPRVTMDDATLFGPPAEARSFT